MVFLKSGVSTSIASHGQKKHLVLPGEILRLREARGPAAEKVWPYDAGSQH